MVIDPEARRTEYGYDGDGRLIRLTDPNGNVTTWERDIQGRVTAKVYADGSRETYAYEARTSRLKQRTDALGQIATRTYAKDDRLTALGYTNAVNATPNVSFAYDAYFPRIRTMTDGNGTTEYSYHQAGQPGALQLRSEDGPFGHDRLEYTYDALGRMSSRKIDGQVESFTYDLLGRLTGHSSPLGSFALSYLGQTGQVVRRALPPTTNQPWTVDWTYGDNLADRRLEAIDHSPQPNSGARNYAYTTTSENRILGLAESTAAGTTATWGYTYDQADRLTQALSSLVGPYGYELDAGDNLLSIQTPPGIATSTYNSLNQIDLRNGQPFTYDAAGNLLDDGRRSYEWDAEQRLVRIRYPGSTRFTEFRYDGLGRRTAIMEYNGSYNYTETRYLWCGERICQARNGSDAVIRRYYDEGELGPNAYYYAQDHLDSVRDLVNTSGQVLASYDYDPYGNPTRTEESGSARADYRYAGLFYHAPSGLYLTHYRVYDPVTARWLSRDPIEEAGGVNLYGYVEGNPIAFADPYGLDATATLGRGVVFFGGAAAADGPSPVGDVIGAIGFTAFAAYAAYEALSERPSEQAAAESEACPGKGDKWKCEGYANYEIIGQNKHVIRGPYFVAYGPTESDAAYAWKKKAQAAAPPGHTARHIRPRCKKIK